MKFPKYEPTDEEIGEYTDWAKTWQDLDKGFLIVFVYNDPVWTGKKKMPLAWFYSPPANRYFPLTNLGLQAAAGQG